MQQRQTAYKLWISNVIAGPYTKATEEFSPNYITFKEMQVSRVNIIANVIETFTNEEQTHSSITLDDGSGTIRVKTFKENVALMQDIAMGDLVMIIGKIKEYNNEIYIVPEIVKKLANLNWGKVRHHELLKEIGPASPYQPQPRVQQEVNNTPALQVQTITAPVSERAQDALSYLEKSEEGMSVSELALSLNVPALEIEKIILELLKNNDIYQNKPGHYKLL